MPRAPKRTRTHRRKITGSVQMIEGVWYALQHDIEVTECCHCGLVHETQYKLERGRIWWRTKVNSQATTAARKRAGVRIVTASPKG